MIKLSRIARGAAFSLALLAAGCMNDSGDGGNPPAGDGGGVGTFRVELKPATAISQGYSTISGKVYAGPSPSILSWKEDRKSGACILWTPTAPFCDGGCGSNGVCVADNKCEEYPKSVTVGRVTVTGVKTKAGATSFAMDPLQNNYQPPSGTILEFPPFAEGAEVSISAAGDTAMGPFTATAKGISPLAVAADSLVLEDGKPLVLKWTAPGSAGTRVHVELDISHHGGTRGKIECDTEDNGRLEIAAELVDRLKALGVAGFPIAELTRQSKGTSAQTEVDLILESKVVKDLTIPGLISCSGHQDCPDGQTCQQDMQCK